MEAIIGRPRQGSAGTPEECLPRPQHFTTLKTSDSQKPVHLPKSDQIPSPASNPYRVFPAQSRYVRQRHARPRLVYRLPVSRTNRNLASEARGSAHLAKVRSDSCHVFGLRSEKLQLGDMEATRCMACNSQDILIMNGPHLS